MLTKKDLDAVLSNYPLIKKQIVATAEERQNMVKKRNEAALKKKQEEDRKKKEEEDRKRQEEEDKKAKEETEKDNQNNEEENKVNLHGQKLQCLMPERKKRRLTYSNLHAPEKVTDL